MPRISQDQTQERHAFLLELFRKQPDLSSKEVLVSYKDKFGASISPKTLSELRDQAQSGLSSASSDADAEPEETSLFESTSSESASSPRGASSSETNGASQPQKIKPRKGSRNVFVDAPREHLDFLEKMIQQLQDAGANNVRIDHSTERWMVLVVDAK